MNVSINQAVSDFDATPLPKELFLGYIKSGYSTDSAIAEYIDNSIQQSLKNDRGANQTIRVDSGANGNTFFVTILDNAGGCPARDAYLFIRPGASTTSIKDAGISRFGVGGKISGLSIADRIIIESRCQGEKGFKTILDREEILTKGDWRFSLRELQPDSVIDEGQTKVTLEKKSGVELDQITKNHLSSAIGQRYALIEESRFPTIIINGKTVKQSDPQELLLTQIEAPTNCGPKKYDFDQWFWTDSNRTERSKVRFTVTVGLAAEATTTGNSGARVFCNGRQVGGWTELGLVEDGNRVHIGDKEAWLRAIVDIRGPAELMPWTSRKDGLDASSAAFKVLQSSLSNAYDRFMKEQLNPTLYENRNNLKGKRNGMAVRMLIEETYRQKLQNNTLHQSTARSLIKNTESFKRAVESISAEEPEVGKESQPIKSISGKVEREKIEQAREIIEKTYGEDKVTDNEIVKRCIEHYVRCSRNGAQ